MTEQDKVTVDDIIGIVKTEEQTNSVEEVRKLRGRENKTAKRYIYANIVRGYEILDSWFGYTGDDEPTEREIEEYDYLVIGIASNQDAAEGICRRLNDQQDEINHLSNFGLHVILDKKNKEIEQLKTELTELKASKEDNYNIDDGLW